MKLFKALLLVLLSTSCLAQTGVHRFGNVFARGNQTNALVVPYAKVKVCVAATGCTVLQNIYTDIALTNRAPNPVTADANGAFSYYFASGCVDEQQSSPNMGTVLTTNVCLSTGGGAPLPSGAVVFGITPTTARAAIFSDLVSLFGGGSCVGFLENTGACAPASTVVSPSFSVPFSNSGASAYQSDTPLIYTPSTHILSSFAQGISATNPTYSTGADLAGFNYSVVQGVRGVWSGTNIGPSNATNFVLQELTGSSTQTGLNIGGTTLSPLGPLWAYGGSIVVNNQSYTPGIFQGVNVSIDHPADGDTNAGTFTESCSGGFIRAADEGCNPLETHQNQYTLAQYPTGTVATTGAAGATSVVLTTAGTAPNVPTGTYAVDTQSPILTNAHTTGLSTPVGGLGAPFMGVFTTPVDATVTQSTAWGVLVATQYLNWTATTSYSLGALLNVSGIRWVAVQAGTSGGTIPTFAPQANGTIITDGTVKWTYGGGGIIVGGIMQQLNPQTGPTPVTAVFDMGCAACSGTAFANATDIRLGGGWMETVVPSNVGAFTGGLVSFTTNTFGSGCTDGFYTPVGTGGGGSGAQVLIGCAAGVPFFVEVLAPGSGYTSPPSFSYPGTATFNAVISSKTQSVTFTPLFPHGTYPSNVPTSGWQGGTHGVQENNYWTNYTQQPWRATYYVLGADTTHSLVGQYLVAGQTVAIPNYFDQCKNNLALTNLVSPGTGGAGTVTANVASTFCSPEYVGVGAAGNTIANAVISSAGAFNGTGTNFTENADGSMLTWTQSVTSGTQPTGLISFPQNVFSFNLYPGVRIIQPCTFGETTTSCPLDVNDVTFTSGDTFITGPDPSFGGPGYQGVQQINAPDSNSSTTAISLLYQGNGINGQFDAIHIQNLNQAGAVKFLYSGFGGIQVPGTAIKIDGVHGYIMKSDPATAGFADFFFNCPLTPAGCGDLTHQLFAVKDQGLGTLEFWPGANNALGVWAAKGTGNTLFATVGVESENYVGMSNANNSTGTAYPVFLTVPNSCCGSPFAALGTGTVPTPSNGMSTPIGDQSTALGLGQLSTGILQAGTNAPNVSFCAVFAGGTLGSTAYTYIAVGNTLQGHTVPTTSFNMAVGNATLSSTNYNIPSCNFVAGTQSLDYWRGTNTPGLPLGRICHGLTYGQPCQDTGQVPDISGAPPNTDTSGKLALSGNSVTALLGNGTDTALMPAGTVATSGPLCVDANTGLSTACLASPIASASTIVLGGTLQHITGTAAIATITAPANFTGCVDFIADAAWTTTTGGNISSAAITAVANTVYHGCYDGSHWFIK